MCFHFLNFKLSEGENVSKDYFLSQRIEYTWIGAYTFCRMNGMKLAKLSTNSQYSHFRAMAVRYSKFPKVFIDVVNARNESEQISCKLSQSNIFPRVKISKRSCDTSKGAFVCEDVANGSGTTEIVKLNLENDTFTHVGDFSQLIIRICF